MTKKATQLPTLLILSFNIIIQKKIPALKTGSTLPTLLNMFKKVLFLLEQPVSTRLKIARFAQLQ